MSSNNPPRMCKLLHSPERTDCICQIRVNRPWSFLSGEEFVQKERRRLVEVPVVSYLVT